MKKRKLVIEELSEVVFSDEKIKINKLGNNLIFEIGKETTTDVAESVSIMMKNLDSNHKIWDLEVEINIDDIVPEKCLYWLTGGHTEWKNLEHYKKSWSDSYLFFQEEFGISIINILKKSKKLKHIREEFKKHLNLPTLYDFAISKDLIR